MFGSRYSRMDQVKFFKGCLPQILLAPFFNILFYLIKLCIETSLTLFRSILPFIWHLSWQFWRNATFVPYKCLWLDIVSGVKSGKFSNSVLLIPLENSVLVSKRKKRNCWKSFFIYLSAGSILDIWDAFYEKKLDILYACNPETCHF